jgi:hypothetical protein
MCLVWTSEQTANFFSIQQKLIGFYDRSTECLLRGTTWVFKSDKYIFVLKGLMCSSVRGVSLCGQTSNRFFIHTAELKVWFIAFAALRASNICRPVLAVEITNLVTEKFVPVLEASGRSSYLVDCVWMSAYRNTEELCARAPGIFKIKRFTKLPEILKFIRTATLATVSNRLCDARKGAPAIKNHIVVK